VVEPRSPDWNYCRCLDYSCHLVSDYAEQYDTERGGFLRSLLIPEREHGRLRRLGANYEEQLLIAAAQGFLMNDSFKKFQERFDIFANQQAAEIEAVKAVLQEFIRASLATNPEKERLFLALKKRVDDRLAEAANEPSLDQDAQRKAQLVQFRAARIFDELAPAFGIKSSSDSAH
jgi:hypothetical protein